MKNTLLSCMIGVTGLVALSAQATPRTVTEVVNWYPNTPGCTMQSVGGYSSGNGSYIAVNLYTCGADAIRVSRHQDGSYCYVRSETAGYTADGSCPDYWIHAQ